MTVDEIARSAVRGMQTAATSYHRISGDNPWWAPEVFTSSHVAMALSADLGAPVTLEEMEATLRLRGRGDARGRYHRDAKRGRCDVAVYNGDGTLKAAIEVKRSFSLSGIRKDADRLRGLYYKGTVKHGLIAAYGTYAEEGLAWTRLDELAENINARCLHSRCRRSGPWNGREENAVLLFAVLRVR